MNWLISANSSIYDHASSFEHHNFIDWKQGTTNYKVGDIIYIYCAQPIKKIRYKCRVDNTELSFENIRDDKDYWITQEKYNKALDGKFMRLTLVEQIDNDKLSLVSLLNNGLKAAPQGPKKLDGKLLEYIEENFNDSNQSDIFPEMIDKEIQVFEGIKKQITVNKYERSSIARAECIEYHGTNCTVCGMSFEDLYGIIGKDFIHVHHIIPIHTVGKEYKVDYKNDLIPVCPNCHSMLHRKFNEKCLTVDELKKILKQRALR